MIKWPLLVLIYLGHPKEKEKVLSMQKLYLKTKKQFDAHHKYLAIQRQKLKSEERQLKEATALEQKKILDDSRGRILGKSLSKSKGLLQN